MTAQLLKQTLDELKQQKIYYHCWRIKNQIIIDYYWHQHKKLIDETLAKVFGCEPYSLLWEHRKKTNNLKQSYKIIIHQHEHLYPGITQIMQAFFKFV